MEVSHTSEDKEAAVAAPEAATASASVAAAVDPHTALRLSDRTMRRTAQNKHVVILRTDKAGPMFTQVQKGKQLKLLKQKCPADPLLGAPFGQVFQLDRGKLEPIEVQQQEVVDVEDTDIPTEDNRALFDQNVSQKLAPQDIQQLKQEKSGAEIVKLLAEHSTTFEQKTEFSRQKYIKKKKSKYCNEVTLVRPSVQNVCQAYFDKYPRKTLYMRYDTLAFMLHVGNVGAHAKSLVVDSVSGLLLAGVADRHNGFGAVVNLHPTQSPFMNAVNDSLLSDRAKGVIQHFPMHLLAELPTLSPKMVEKYGAVLPLLRERQFDSLVIATRFAAKDILLPLLPLLIPSAPFAVYSQSMQPLAECMKLLRDNQLALEIDITELLSRDYQVLPNRTHPFVRTSGTGGYVLHGYRLAEEMA